MDKLLQDFLQFEADKKLFQRKYRGVYYWQTMRFDIANIADKFIVRPIQIKKRKDKKWIKEKLYTLRNAMFDIRNWDKLEKADILYFDQCSYRNVDGKKVDTNFSYFGFDKEYSIQHCFYLNRGNAKKYVGKGVGTAIAELKSYFVICLSKMLPFIFDDSEKKFIHELCNQINSKFKTEIIPSQMVYRAEKASILYRIYFKYYMRMLKKIKPKVIFVVCHYSDNLWPLYPVAKKMDIPVIELQHGRITSHISYDYMDLSDLGKQLPDYLFTYGDFWHDYISLPICMKACSIGNPFLEDRYIHYSNNEMDNKAIVIYSDRWELNGKRLMEFALSISDRYHAEGYKVFFKIHPGEYADWKEKYVNHKNDDKITVITDEIELYKLLSMAKHQIGVGSTTLYEAAIFDVNIYILDPKNEIDFDGMQPLINLKRAYLIHDLNEFEHYISLDSIQNEYFGKEVWKKDACKNAQKELIDIIFKNK